MKTFRTIAAQGELTIRSLDSRKQPDGFKKLDPANGHYVIGHSETGHHHVIGADGATVQVLEKPSEGMRILHMILENPTVLEHQRPFDTHEPIALDPGAYEVRISREFDPYAELARRSMD